MATSKIDNRGRTTIPAEVRRHLNLKPGDQIEFIVEPDRKVRIVGKIDIRSLKGILGLAPRRASLKEMEAAIRKGAINRYRRSQGD